MSHTETGCGLHMGCMGRAFATSGLNKCKHLVRKAVHTWASKDNDLLCFHIFSPLFLCLSSLGHVHLLICTQGQKCPLGTVVFP